MVFISEKDCGLGHSALPQRCMFELTRPNWLIGLLVLPLLAHYFYWSLVDLPRRQMVVSLLVRSLVSLLLLLALAGLTWLSTTNELFVVFAVDESLSVDVDARKFADEFIREATALKGENQFTVLPFATEPQEFLTDFELTRATEPTAERLPIAQVDKAPPEKPATVDNFRTVADEEAFSQASNLQAAIEAAVAGIPPHYVPRIVLLSDGNETIGDARRAAMNAGVRIDTLPMATRADKEIQVSAVNVPAQVAQGEPFNVEVIIDSNHEDEVLVEVYKGEHEVISENEKLKSGENRFRFQQQVDRPTEFAVRISRPVGTDGLPDIDAFEDSLVDNNMATGLVFAAGKPRVLLIESIPELARNLEWGLEEEGILVDTRPPQGMPDSLSDLQNYEVVILSNVPATDLSARTMEVVRTWVSDLGGGLIMLGGDQSFGLGGYYRSVLEEVLPVRSDFEKEKEKPSLAMVLIIDKSGSMGVKNMELAKDAARAAVELLGPRDQAGVIAFDGRPAWVSDIRSVTQQSLILDRIASIEAGGGTEIYPALEEGYQSLMSANAKLKHVILLTDGVSQGGDFDGLARTIAASRMTLSTVGFGDANSDLLKRIAEIGNGRYYFTADPSSIPQIFARETMTASKSAINEEPFLPQVIRASQLLEGINFDEAPFLLGYVVTRPKPTSEVILATETGDPLLALWRYGLGISVAFTSDAKSRWAAEWMTWSGFNRFWAQVIRHCMQKTESKGLMFDVARKGGKATVTVDSVDRLGNFLNQADTQLTLIDPRLNQSAVPMSQVAPGRYEAEIEVPDAGAWHIQMSQSHRGQPIHQQSRGLIVGYPDELRLKPTNDVLLRSIARTTSGQFAPKPGEVFADHGQTALRAVPLRPWLLTLALLLFVLDVALRRIDFSLLPTNSALANWFGN